MLSELVAEFTTYLAVVAALVGVWRYRQLTSALRYIALLTCFDAATELIVAILHHLKLPNLFLYPLSLGGEALLLTLAYRRVLASSQLKRTITAVLTVYLLFTLVEAWLKLGSIQYFVTVQVISNLYLLVLAGLYFRQLLNELYVTQLSRDPLFWLSTGLTVYALGNMLIVLTSDYVLAHFSHSTQVLVQHGIRNLFNIGLYAAYLVALLLRPAPRPAA